MSSKDSIPANDAGGEKGVHQVSGVPGVAGADSQATMGLHNLHNSYDDETFMTRNGLNAESFKCKHYGHGLVELDRSMKTRHLHMIAIGGSIGAGFFVGSGGALYKGVSRIIPPWHYIPLLQASSGKEVTLWRCGSLLLVRLSFEPAICAP